jgi:Acetyltransferases
MNYDRQISNQDWLAFTSFAARCFLKNRGKLIELQRESSGRFLILFVGVIRVDVCETVAWFRRVAIREDLQRQSHGRVLLRLAEDFAKTQGCNEVRSNAAVEAGGFYERCGYMRELSGPAPSNSVPMWKSLH